MIDPRFYTLSAPLSLQDIVSFVDAEPEVEGAADEMIMAPASLSESQAGEITFFSDKRRKNQLETAKATACLTTERLAPSVRAKGIIAIITDNPRARFARLTQKMVREGNASLGAKNVDETAIIHPSAVIGEGVSIGPRTRIGANAVIDDGVIIGSDCHIAPLSHIAFTLMGDGCSVKSCSVIGGAGFGMAEDEVGVFNIPHYGRVVMHNNVHIGSNSCVDRGQLGDTILMNDVKLDNLVQVAHNVFLDEGAMLAGHVGVSGSCKIGKKAMFGGRAATADHVNVGDGAILAASAGAMSDVPDGEMWSGIPAMPIREHMRNVATLKKLSKKT